ncbi:MAG: hydrogenase maturation nickel metallochaperone HypA [Gammaproteobacteria bacterium]
MHELSVCQALLTQVAEIAADRGAIAVERIIIEVGPLSGVEAHSLLQAFAVARRGSCAADAVLSIEETPVVVLCLGCGVQTKTSPNRLVCAECGGYRTRIMAGDELRLRRVELRVAAAQSAGLALTVDED